MLKILLFLKPHILKKALKISMSLITVQRELQGNHYTYKEAN